MERGTGDITLEEIECIKKLEPGWDVVFWNRLIPQLDDGCGSGHLAMAVKALRIEDEKVRDFIHFVILDFHRLAVKKGKNGDEGLLFHIYDPEEWNKNVSFFLCNPTRIRRLYKKFLFEDGSIVRDPHRTVPSLAAPIGTGTSAKVIDLISGRRYDYRIRAVATTADGHFSAWTALHGTSAVVENEITPRLASVTGFRIADDRITSVEFRWNPVSGATEGYEIQFSNDGSKWTVLKTNTRKATSVKYAENISHLHIQGESHSSHEFTEPHCRTITESIAAKMEKCCREILEEFVFRLSRSKWDHRISPITVHAGLQLYRYMKRSEGSMQRLIDQVHAKVRAANPACVNPSNMIEKEHQEAEEKAMKKREAKK